MGWLAGLLALGFTLLAGGFFVIVGGALSAAVLQGYAGYQGAAKPPFKPLWKIASLAFFIGLLLGNALQLALGGPSPLSALIGVPVYTLVFAGLLRRKFPTPFAEPAWRWRTLGSALLATLASCGVILTLLQVLRVWLP